LALLAHMSVNREWEGRVNEVAAISFGI
jgi:hypothetical protein